MPLFGRKIGQEAGEAVAAPIEATGKLLDAVFTSAEEKLDKATVLERIAQQPFQNQADINLQEAKHASVFVAGWRPAIGWVCAIALFFYFIPRFCLIAWFWASEVLVKGQLIPYPPDGSESLMELVFAMLGMGALRTADKYFGTTSTFKFKRK